MTSRLFNTAPDANGLSASLRRLASLVALLASLGVVGSASGVHAQDDAAGESADEARREQAAEDDAAAVRAAHVVRDESEEDYATLPEREDPWVLQVSARQGLGFGTAFGDNRRNFIWQSFLRGEIMWMRRGDEHFAIGPAWELMGANMKSFEATVGLAALLPVARGYPIMLSATVGYAVRAHGFNGGNAPVFAATIAGGYRSFNFHHWWMTSVHAYAQIRMDLDNPGRLQFFAGLSIDFAAALVIPALMIRMKVRGGDPDEPEEDEDYDDEEEAPAGDS